MFKQPELEFDVDPYFHQMSAKFDEGGGKGMTDEHGGGEDDGAPATVPDPEATAIIDLVLPASNFLSRLKRSKSKQ